MRTVKEWLQENQGNLRGSKIFEKFAAEHDAEIKTLIDGEVKQSGVDLEDMIKEKEVDAQNITVLRIIQRHITEFAEELKNKI